MAQLPQQFSVDDPAVQDTGGVVLIPNGDYKAIIVDSDLKSNKAGTGQFIELKIVLTEGEHQGTEFTERLNIINQNNTAVEIAYKTLASISRAIGLQQTPANTEELHAKPMIVSIKSKKSNSWTDNNGVQREGSEQSEIKKYKALPAVGVPQQSVVTPEPQSITPPWKK